MARAQLEGVHVDAHRGADFGDLQGVGGGAAEGRDAEVLHQHHLLFGVARGGRDDRRAQALGRVVHAEAAREEAVAVGDLHDGLGRAAGALEGPGRAFGPDVEVALRARRDGRLAGGAGGGVDAHDVAQGRAQHAEGVLVAEVFLDREGQLGEVGDVPDVVGADAGFVHALAVEGDVVVGVADDGAEALALQRAQLGAGQGLGPGKGFGGWSGHGRFLWDGGRDASRSQARNMHFSAAALNRFFKAVEFGGTGLRSWRGGWGKTAGNVNVFRVLK